jgi:hypothetical protein
MMKVYKILVGRPEGKRPLGRGNCRWKNNIKMDPENWCKDVDSILLLLLLLLLLHVTFQWRALINTLMTL